MSKIQLLDDQLISKIAAGEVVERPASVLKEALENSLDANAHRVEVELEAGGKRSISVRDDGSGMDASDALLAFDRHATSKIASFGDLEQVSTLGFRGEALSSIAAVAKVELLTAMGPGEGHRVRVDGGRVVVSEPAACAGGTRLGVRSLFYNVPARRKFLKSPQTELRRCLEVLQGYALARPDVFFRLRHQGRELLRTEATADDRAGRMERIAQVFGAGLAADLVSLPDSERVSGFVGTAGTARGRRLFVFVNRRLLRDRAVLAVFYRAVREQWKSEDTPALFLFLEVAAEEVDVNVHPQKAEVRFRNPEVLREVSEGLRAALAEGLGEGHAPLRTAGLRPLPQLAWEGAGARAGSPSLINDPRSDSRNDPWNPSVASRSSSEVRELSSDGGPRIAEVTYQHLAAPAGGTSSPLSAGGTGSLRLLGQYKGSLILLEGPSSLYLVDQHAAHERILYERFRCHLSLESAASQRLLSPLVLDLSAAEAHSLGQLASELESYGFEVAGLSGSSVAVNAIPSILSLNQAESLLLGLASHSGDCDPEDLPRELLEAHAASLACRSAVRIHRPLGRPEMEQLISELFAAEQPYSCPHGRPTILEMGDAELERRFGRRG